VTWPACPSTSFPKGTTGPEGGLLHTSSWCKFEEVIRAVQLTSQLTSPRQTEPEAIRDLVFRRVWKHVR
jgi:hypothetical protein